VSDAFSGHPDPRIFMRRPRKLWITHAGMTPTGADLAVSGVRVCTPTHLYPRNFVEPKFSEVSARSVYAYTKHGRDPPAALASLRTVLSTHRLRLVHTVRLAKLREGIEFKQGGGMARKLRERRPALVKCTENGHRFWAEDVPQIGHRIEEGSDVIDWRVENTTGIFCPQDGSPVEPVED
jgi:hypothetical protein